MRHDLDAVHPVVHTARCPVDFEAMWRAEELRAQQRVHGPTAGVGARVERAAAAGAEHRPRRVFELDAEAGVLERVAGERRDELERMSRSVGGHLWATLLRHVTRADARAVHRQFAATDCEGAVWGIPQYAGPAGRQARSRELRARGWREDHLAVASLGDVGVGHAILAVLIACHSARAREEVYRRRVVQGRPRHGEARSEGHGSVTGAIDR